MQQAGLGYEVMVSSAGTITEVRGGRGEGVCKCCELFLGGWWRRMRGLE